MYVQVITRYATRRFSLFLQKFSKVVLYCTRYTHIYPCRAALSARGRETERPSSQRHSRERESETERERRGEGETDRDSDRGQRQSKKRPKNGDGRHDPRGRQQLNPYGQQQPTRKQQRHRHQQQQQQVR